MGVMGENTLGFGVVVETTTRASVGNVCVGVLTGWMIGAGAAAARSPQAVVNTQTIKVRIKTRFINLKYIGQKLSGDEFYARLAP
jgi:hypothetical protein